MGHLLGAIDQAKLDEQRGVVQNEKRQGENEPYGRVYELMQTAVYPKGHPYSWTVIGSMEDLDAASLDDVKEWFKTYYGPQNAVLVVAGDVTRRRGEGEGREVLRRHPARAADREARRLDREAHGQSTASRSRTGSPRRASTRSGTRRSGAPPTTTAWTSSPRVLASGKSSRLYKRLVYDDQIATDVAAFQGASEIGSNFIVQATARPGGDLAAVEKAVDEEMARFLRDGPTAEEIERAKTERLAGFVRGVERIGGFGGKSDVLARARCGAAAPTSIASGSSG